jgi:hypothetical protein
MKAALILLLLCSCSLEPEIQVERVCMKYLKTEIGDRHGKAIYIYYFYDEQHKVSYVEYSSIRVFYTEGECVTGLVRR